jgi:uncharacterized membrane protein YozB (DUF420 family)
MIELKDFPTLNASLNLTSTLLLLAGYAAVLKRQFKLHRNLMLCTMVTSAAFLTCYLIYHYNFPRKYYYGDYRLLYILVLGTHTPLAIGMLPFILITTYLGLKGQKFDGGLESPQLAQNFVKHRKFARWTFPVWLYVSVTGVIVYWMLYQMPQHPPVP